MSGVEVEVARAVVEDARRAVLDDEEVELGRTVEEELEGVCGVEEEEGRVWDAGSVEPYVGVDVDGMEDGMDDDARTSVDERGGGVQPVCVLACADQMGCQAGDSFSAVLSRKASRSKVVAAQ